MPNAITPIVIRYVPAVVLRWLTFITDLLLKGRVVTGGAYSTAPAPDIKPQGLLGIPVPKKVKKFVIKKGAEHLRDAIDTPEEREIIAQEAVSRGLSPQIASMATALLTFFALYLANIDIDKAIEDPVWFVKGAALFIGVRILMQWQTPGTAIVEGAVIAKEAKE